MKTEKITEANELTENHMRRTHFQPPKIPISPRAGAPQQSPAPVSKNTAFVNEVRASSPHLAGSLKTKSNPYITDRQRTNTAPFDWAIVSLLLPSTVFVLDIHKRKGVTTYCTTQLGDSLNERNQTSQGHFWSTQQQPSPLGALSEEMKCQALSLCYCSTQNVSLNAGVQSKIRQGKRFPLGTKI